MLALFVADVIVLLAIIAVTLPITRRLLLIVRNRCVTAISAVPLIRQILILLGLLHPNIASSLPTTTSFTHQSSAMGESQPLLAPQVVDDGSSSQHLLGMHQSAVAAAVPRFGGLWTLLVVCSLIQAVASLASHWDDAGSNGLIASVAALIASAPSVLAWLTVSMLLLVQSDAHPTTFLIATVSSVIHTVTEICRGHALPTVSASLIAAHAYLAVVSVMLCFFTFSAIRARRETDDDAAIKKAGLIVPCRETQASVFSRAYFSWMSPLIRLGKTKSLTIEDLPDLAPGDRAEAVIARFAAFSKTSNIKHLGLRLFAFELPCFSLQIFWSLLANLLAILGPYLLYQITGFIEDESKRGDAPARSPFIPLTFAALLGLASLLRALCDGQGWHTGRHFGIRLRTIVVNAIYKKGLRRVTVAPSGAAAKALAGIGKADAAAEADDAAPLVDVAVEGNAKEDITKVYASAVKTDEAASKADAAQAKKDNAANKKKKADQEKKDAKALEDDEAASVGKIVTLMSSDTEKIRESCAFLYMLITAPPQILISITGLLFLLGWPAFAGLFVMIMTLPATYVIADWANKIWDDLMSRTDRRTNAVNEALQGIRIIKFFAWENNFLQKIKEARKKEMSSLVSFFFQNAISQVVWDGAPLLVSFGTFFVYTQIAGYELDARTAFASISLFNSLRIPLLALPEILVEVFKLNVSIGRIQKFLDGPELERYSDSASSASSGVDGEGSVPTIGFKDGWFSWHVGEEPTGEKKGDETPSSNETTPLLSNATSTAPTTPTQATSAFTLRNLNLNLPVGGLTCICGSTGSGKSSLIQALLGEMKRLSGSKHLPDSPTERGLLHGGVAYVAQTSWLMNATIRDNICFGEKYEETRYARVVRACALVKDFETFEAGDLTEIGEKGINLSGGQKQRVSLARAVYSRASYILLDDPLSAVDAPTARHLFTQAICTLLKNRTRILVTHAVSLTLPHSDHIVVMQNGEILAQGAPGDVVGVPGIESILPSDAFNASASLGDVDGLGPLADGEEEEEAKVDFANGKTREDARKLVAAEESQTGAVKLSIYLSYLVAAGGAVFMIVFLSAMGMERGAQAMDSFWIKRWVDAYRMADNATDDLAAFVYRAGGAAVGDGLMVPVGGEGLVTSLAKQKVDTLFYIGVYGLIVLLWIVCNMFAFAVRCFGSYTASIRLHDQLIERILGAPIRFFDKTPLGRILNRASKDISTIDQEVMMSYYYFFALLLDLVTITIIVTSITPFFIVAFVPFMYIYYGIARDYLASSREMKRLDSVTRSPIYSMFSESLVGASTIRAYGAESRFEAENLGRVNKNHRAYFYLWCSNRWLGVRISTVAGLVIFTSATITVLNRDAIGAGLAGISLIWSLNFSDYLGWLIRVHAGLEMSLNAVERVEEYLVIEQERPAVIEGMRPSPDWPTTGAIKIQDLELRYSPDLDPVLKNITANIPGGSKVGIVGRTGAGKSSLTLALFRIVEPSGGHIEIDDINISEIGLRDLRSKLTIIPQDPVLFAGTIRSNMDPFDEFDDARIWECLERVHILETMQTSGGGGAEMGRSRSVSTLVEEDGEEGKGKGVGGSAALSLDSVVAEGGQNYSQGQRQLLCLARALLKSSRVAVLDEATASVDNETDARIQETIRGPDFANVTVLSIAHRLRTVADYDLILVLDKGSVAQFGTPWELVQQEGIFKSMCEESGEFAELEEMARVAAGETAAVASSSSSSIFG
ncbi:hypothetical protein HDU67_006307 [Dinochytrium kinnereticum]|nr:hypothetical protein HDU67_006307 [Dinochytrium kinnereticum]